MHGKHSTKITMLLFVTDLMSSFLQYFIIFILPAGAGSITIFSMLSCLYASRVASQRILYNFTVSTLTLDSFHLCCPRETKIGVPFA
jgi:hypothetical protein